MASQTRLPTSNAAVSHGSIPGAAGDAWDTVNDPVGSPDDDSSYCVSTGGNAISYFNFTAFAITSSAVAYLRVVYRARNLAGNATASRSVLRINGTTYGTTATNNTQQSTYTEFTFDYLTNPDTGAAWTEADIEGTGSNPLQGFGFRNQNNSVAEEDRFTQVYATVEYTDAGGGGGLAIPIAAYHYRHHLKP